MALFLLIYKNPDDNKIVKLLTRSEDKYNGILCLNIVHKSAYRMEAC